LKIDDIVKSHSNDWIPAFAGMTALIGINFLTAQLLKLPSLKGETIGYQNNFDRHGRHDAGETGLHRQAGGAC
jgi:hypothetical protein